MGERGVGITPMSVLRWAEEVAGCRFTIDGCAREEHARLDRFISPDEDFMTTNFDFTGETVWLNPPYVRGRDGDGYSTGDFVMRASRIRGRYHCTVAVLLESNMSSTRYFDKWVGTTPEGRRRNAVDLYFHPGRIQFGECGQSNPKASVLVVFRPLDTARTRP